MILILDLSFAVALVGLLPVWIVMFALRPNFRAGILSRLANPGVGSKLQRSVWLHGSSAGEIDLMRPLIERIEAEHPATPIVISAFAVSGYLAAKRAFPGHRVIYLPAEFSPAIRRALRALDPQLIVLIESELWPNLILTASGAGIPVCLLNGKMSEKSFRMHRRTRLIPFALTRLSAVAAQTEEHARRFAALGLDPRAVHVTGNMKYDLTTLDDAGELRRTFRSQYGLNEEAPVCIAGSIHTGEDEAIAYAFSRLLGEGYELYLVLVPRYPAEAGEVAETLSRYGLDSIRKTAIDAGSIASRGEPGCVLIVDTMGELKRFYAMSDMAYVGGSLFFRGSNKGGHNLMEPAILGVALLFGPHNFSFKETVHDLLEDRAGILVHDKEEIYENLKRLLDQPDVAAELGRRARALVLRNRGATTRNFSLIRSFLGGCARSGHKKAS